MKTVMMYTDGCCLSNPNGKGGAGVVLSYNGYVKRFGKHLPETTNNRAELEAIIHGLELLTEPCVVNLYSDSQVTVKCITGDYGRNSNLDLWQQYDAVSAQHNVIAEWLRKDSHSYNMEAHDLANKYARKATP